MFKMTTVNYFLSPNWFILNPIILQKSAEIIHLYFKAFQREKGIILGEVNPLSIKVFKEIPESKKSSFRNASHDITPSTLRIFEFCF